MINYSTKQDLLYRIKLLFKCTNVDLNLFESTLKEYYLEHFNDYRKPYIPKPIKYILYKNGSTLISLNDLDGRQKHALIRQFKI